MPCHFEHHHHLRLSGPGCQFAVPEEELTEFEGRTWCPFHLPLIGKANWNAAQIGAFNEAVLAHIEQAKQKAEELPTLPPGLFPVGEGERWRERIADLSGVVFPQYVHFDRCSSEGNGLPDVLFLNAVFDGFASFGFVTFKGYALFNQAIFRGVVNFRHATFHGPATFGRVSFEHDAFFQEATFCNGAQFYNAIFGRFSWFDGAVFHRDATFYGATFNHQTSFDDSKFVGDVWFEGNPAPDEPSERADVFRTSVTFRRTKFHGRAVFTNRRFLSSTDFRGAGFDVAPEFHNAVLHQDTGFAGTEFKDRKGTEQVDAASAYRTLKLAMESVRSRDEEARFYAYEQQSLRQRKDSPYSVRLFSWLYEITADYGRSILRPLGWVLGSFGVFFLVYLAALTDTTIYWTDLVRVLRFTLQQVLYPFAAFRPAATEAVSVALASAAAIHSLLTFSFLALFLLALRRRFKLD